MESRPFPRTPFSASVIGLGTWQLGADWGDVSESDARAVLEASAEAGVTFYDTADVYGDGRSEQLVGAFVADHPDAGFTVATKMGRRLEQVPSSYVESNFRAWLDRSRRNLGVDTIDLVQLHCPPSEVIDDDATYDVLDRLVSEGVIAAYGVSVETADQALSAIRRPHVASVQIILNAFRMKPLDEVLPAAAAAGVGIIARVPLASGLLSGKYDLRHHLRAGRPQELQPRRQRLRRRRDLLRRGLRDRRRGGSGVLRPRRLGGPLRRDAGAGRARVGGAAAGCHDGDPGRAQRLSQASSNAAAGSVGELPASLLDDVRDLYDRRIRDQVHARW